MSNIAIAYSQITISHAFQMIGTGTVLERKWHFAMAIHNFGVIHFSQLTSWPYIINGSAHILMGIIYCLPFINRLIFIVYQLGLFCLFPDFIQERYSYALNKGYVDAAYLLFLRGASLYIQNDQKETLIDICLNDPKRYYHYIQHILAEKVSLPMQHPCVRQLLEYAADQKDTVFLSKLLDWGASIPIRPPKQVKKKQSKISEGAFYECIFPCQCAFRSKEKAWIKRIFLQDKRSYPLIVGPPGVGKTALAKSCDCDQLVVVDLVLFSKATALERRQFNQFIDQNPESVIIIDELENIENRIIIEFTRLCRQSAIIGCSRSNTIQCDCFTILELEPLSATETLKIAQARYRHVKLEVLQKGLQFSQNMTTQDVWPGSLLHILNQADIWIRSQQDINGSLSFQYQQLNWQKQFLLEAGFDRDHPKVKGLQEEMNSLWADEQYPSVDVPLLKQLACRNKPIPHVETFLRANIFGQNHVIREIAPLIENAIHGWNVSGKPLGALHFVGLTGTGKTEMAKLIARCLDIRFVHIDMSKYREAHSASTLVGAAAGYVGYDQGGKIQEEAKKGAMVLLLDEIDKCHPHVMSNLLLHLLEEGKMFDPLTRTMVKFNRTFVILASNLGSQAVIRAIRSPASRVWCKRKVPTYQIDPRQILELVQPSLEQFVEGQYELLSRFVTLAFVPIMDIEVKQKIVSRFLQETQKWLMSEFKIVMQWKPSLVNYYVALIQPEKGGRAARSAIEVNLRNLLGRVCEKLKEGTIILKYHRGIRWTIERSFFE